VKDFPHFFKIFLDVPLLAGEGLYTYGSQEALICGEKVLVPFGRGTKTVSGYVLGEGEPREAKPVYSRTGQKYFDEVRAGLILWIWSHYLSSSRSLLGYLSPQILEESLKKVQLNLSLGDSSQTTKDLKSPGLRKAFSFLLERGGSAYLEEIPYRRSIASLEKKGLARGELEQLKGQEKTWEKSERCLFWGPWKEQLRFLMEKLQEALDSGKQTLVLLPENSLISPLVEILKKQGISSLEYSGDLGAREKRKVFFSSQNDPRSIILGTWVSLFLPFFRLGGIYVLHEESKVYRILSPPHFHAVKAAKALAKLSGASLVLFSRAPSLESYLDTYQDLKLIKKETPAIKREVVIHRGNKGLAPSVLRTVQKFSQEGKRSLIFLNRKGYANILHCEDCGEDFNCPYCSVHLTPHVEELICHYCGYRAQIPLYCPRCHGTNLKTRGVGLEKLESLLRPLMGDSLLRVDSEVIKSRKGIEEKVRSFREIPGSVLLATSILQGHAVPPVSLVVLINLDYSLGLPYYTATERAFQLLKNLESLALEKLMVQVSSPLSLNWLEEDFYLEELRARKEAGFPPYRRILRLLFEGAPEELVWEAARKVRGAIEQTSEFLLTDPIPCMHYKIKGKWRVEMLMRFPNGPIPEDFRKIPKISLPKGVQLQLQLEPEELD